MNTDGHSIPLFLGTDFLFFAFICENLCPSVDYKPYPELRVLREYPRAVTDHLIAGTGDVAGVAQVYALH